MKKIRILCLILSAAVLLSHASFGVSATGTNTTEPTTAIPNQPIVQPQPDLPFEDNKGDSSVASGCHSINAQVPMWGSGQLLETAGSAMLYELNSDTIMYAWNPDVQVHPASLVKIMTCLVALENSKLTDKVTVTSTALSALPSDSTPNFFVGETWTMEQMLYCMMVGGYNDAAAVIAEYIAGSQQGFAAMMNRRAQEIGCTDTTFMNATGFHDDAQLSTARDLVRILREALKNELFMQFFSEDVYRLPANELSGGRFMDTTNYMMNTNITAEYFDARVTGGRTGVTDARERCLIVTAESKGLHYIAIVMCAKSVINNEGKFVRFGSYEEVKELLKLGFDGYKVTQILGADQVLSQFPVANGENSITVGPSETVYTVLPAEITQDQLSYRYQQSGTPFTAPIQAGEQISTVQVWYGNVCVAQSPVVTRNSSAVRGSADNAQGIEKNNDGAKIALSVIGILAAVGLSIAIVVYLVQLVRRSVLRAQHRRRRRNRRRSR